MGTSKNKGVPRQMIFNILIFLFILGILIFVHEIGHFIAARMCGVRVEKFAFGFGPPIFKLQLKDTLLLICAIPLGGYVKMAGDEKDNAKGADDEFGSKPVGQRAKIVFFGPLFNLILSFLVFWLIFVVSGVPSKSAKVGDVLKYGPTLKSEFSDIELKVLSDRGIISGNKLGAQYALWTVSDLNQEVLLNSDFEQKQISEILGLWGRSVKVVDKEKLEERLLGELLSKNILYDMNVYWNVLSAKDLEEKLKDEQLNVSRFIALLKTSRYPAFKAGLKKNDIILSVNNKKVNSWIQMSDEIRASKGEIVFGVLRGQENFNIKVMPEMMMVSTISGQEEISVVGISANFEKFKPLSSFIDAGKKLYNVTSVTLKGIGSLITRKLPFKEAVSGPIGIGVITSKFARAGIMPLLELLAILSLSLGIINLFPIPVLDGGHLLFMGIEKIRNKPVSAKWENFFTQFGMYALLTLMVFVTYNDIVKFSPRKKGFDIEQFELLKKQSLVVDVINDSPYAYWAVDNDEGLNKILDKNTNLDREQVFVAWRDSFKITEVLAKDE